MHVKKIEYQYVVFFMCYFLLFIWIAVSYIVFRGVSVYVNLCDNMYI